jgi:hypothetical protein
MRFIDPRALLFLGVLLLGCGPNFDPPAQLRALRVLGVQKDIPYAQIGDTVHLQMLWEDASPKAGRPVQIAWSGPCFDPAGDLYYSCFTAPTDPAQSSPLDGLATGDTTSFTMPPNYVDGTGKERPIIRTATSENNAPYGVVFVFFAACAGQLVPIPTTDATAFPLGCQDDAGKLLGADDFVAGYTSIYAFGQYSNDNPVIGGFEFNGQPVDPSAMCLGDACRDLAEAAAPDPDSIDCGDPMQAPRCVPTCSDDGKSPCHGYAIRPTLDQAQNQEQDSVSAKQLGRNVGEQMWIDYYTDGGGFKSSVRLLNDATNGWNSDYGTEFYASKTAKISRVWALVHDNRGGVAWAGISVKTE